MAFFGRIIAGFLFVVVMLGHSTAQAQVYSESFTAGTTYNPGTSQNDNWTSFHNGLPTSGLDSIKINGSRDTTGYICTNAPLVQEIADNLRNSTVATVVCGGQNWSTGSCSGPELSVGSTAGVCQCNSNYTVRANHTSQWGGIAGTTCSAPTQSMAVSFNTDTIDQDYSDAPTSGTNYSYAVHEIVSGLQLGAIIDADPGLLGNSDASGDGSDDDGIVIPQLIELGSSTITATVSGTGGYLQGWIDWNGDGDFDDGDEQVALNLQDANSDGIISIPVTVPFNTTSNQTFARFRWSTTVSLSNTAYSTSGEVEDYALTIDQLTLSPTILYSEDFTSGASYNAGSVQFDNWTSFTAGLPTTDMISIKIHGSLDTTGYVCTNASAVQEIANNLRNSTVATVVCEGRNWSTGSCSGPELSVGTTAGVCQCNSNYTVRANHPSQWGGIGGTTCSAPTQTLAVSFNTDFLDQDYSDASTSGTNYGDAVHEIVSGVQLGAAIDADSGALGNSDASGDGTDDDGIVIPPLIESGITTITATVSGSGGYLQGWIDWNDDGDFDDSDEQVALNLQDSDSDGTISIPITVPFNAATTQTFARFRWSTTANLSSIDYSTAGEVEDYALSIVAITSTSTPVYSEDFVSGTSYNAGAPQFDNWTSFTASLPTSGLTSLKISGSLDTTGYVCTDESLVQTIANNLRTSTVGTVVCDGRSWSTGSCAGPELSVGSTAGVCQCNSNYTVRANHPSQWGGIGSTTCSAPTQTMSVGFSITEPLLDYSDAPTTSTSYLDAVHEVISGVQLGAAIDTDSGPLGNSDATGDGTDDDGITIPSLSQSATASFTAAVSGASGYLQGWIDWNGDGDFADSGEQIATDLRDDGAADDVAYGDGVIQFNVAVPASTTTNQTFARFRWSNSSSLNSADPANSGEVEDYAVTIVGNPLSVTSTADTDTVGTLRYAIGYANANAGDDAITFDIAGAGPHVITLTSVLPALTDDGISIDGSSQSGASCGDLWAGTPHVLEIVIDANGGSFNALRANAADILIKGLSIVGAGNWAVLAKASADNVDLQCNYVGLQPDGTADGNGNGIKVLGSSVTIGGAGAADGNVIGYNTARAIRLDGGSSATQIEGNFIGTDPTGTSAAANVDAINTSGSGITIAEIRKNLIAGNSTAAILFNSSAGITGSSGDVVIAGNYIGVDRTGVVALANGGNGIQFANDSISGVTIGGTTTADRNIISGNLTAGIELSTVSDVDVLGNYIGLNAASTATVPNESNGMRVGSVSDTNIGNGLASGRNVITGNLGIGINNYGDNDTLAISGNYIGTDLTGNVALTNAQGNSGNSRDAITVNDGAKNNVIVSDNVIGGFEAAGIEFVQTTGSGNSITGNSIGIGADGSSNIAGAGGLGEAGILVTGYSFDTFDVVIGGTGAGEGNRVGHSANDAIRVSNRDGVIITGNTITDSDEAGIALQNNSEAAIYANLIYNNTGIGIDLDRNDVTINDEDDSDDGANERLNFPVLNSLATDGSTTITYDFNLDVPTNAQGYRIDFYRNSAAHSTGYGEGEIHLGSIDIAHDGGDQRFTGAFTANSTVAQGAFVSATTTRKTGPTAYDITSEFSLSFAGGAPAALTTEISTIVFDPSSAGLFAVPGNDMITAMTVTNTGEGPVDGSSITLFGAIASEFAFRNDDIEDGGAETDPVSFVQSVGAGLSFTYASDVRYSDSGSVPADFASCVYTPSAGYDANVRFICINPKGALAADDPDPNFSVSFRTQIE